MARPERRDVDYFPFYVKDGKTLFILESQYGCKGTGFFTNVLRFLCQTPDHHYQIKDESDRLFFFSRCHCDEVSGAGMLEVMLKTGKLSRKLWETAGVIASEDLLTSIEDAYRKRNNKIITIQEIEAKYITSGDNQVNGADNPTLREGLPDDSEADNPQSKVKKRKEKRKKKPLTPWDDQAITLNDAFRDAAKKKGLNNGQVESTFAAFRDKALSKAWEYADWIAAWRNFIDNQITWGNIKPEGNTTGFGPGWNK